MSRRDEGPVGPIQDGPRGVLLRIANLVRLRAGAWLIDSDCSFVVGFVVGMVRFMNALSAACCVVRVGDCLAE